MFEPLNRIADVPIGYNIQKEKICYNNNGVIKIIDIITKSEIEILVDGYDYDTGRLFIINNHKYLNCSNVQKDVTNFRWSSQLYELNENYQINKRVTLPGFLIFEFSQSAKHFVLNTGFDFNTKSSKCGLYSIDSNELLFEAESEEQLILFQTKVFGVSQTFICERNMTNGDILWKLEYENQQLFPRIVYTNNHLVLFAFSDKPRLFCYDYVKDEILWEVESKGDGIYVDEQKNILHILKGYYRKIDLETGEVLASCFDHEYFLQSGIMSYRYKIVMIENHIITTDNEKGRIGAFNTETFKFDWIHEEKDIYFPSPQPMYYHAPYLFLHDNKKTLHIYKKTDI